MGRPETPLAVRRELRQEVGFGCPYPDCGRPYLEYHHFDPPWAERHHFDPKGMIALCPEHHTAADRKTWTKEQLREFKRSGRANVQQVAGRFLWMREQFLGVLGSNFVYDSPILFLYNGQALIRFRRDTQGHLLVYLRMPKTPTKAEFVVDGNDWVLSRDDVTDVECSPGGDKLAVVYKNGDTLGLTFREMASVDTISRHYPASSSPLTRRFLTSLQYPLVTVEFRIKVAALDMDINVDAMHLPRATTVMNCVSSGYLVAFAVGDLPPGVGAAVHLGMS